LILNVQSLTSAKTFFEERAIFPAAKVQKSMVKAYCFK